MGGGEERRGEVANILQVLHNAGVRNVEPSPLCCGVLQQAPTSSHHPPVTPAACAETDDQDPPAARLRHCCNWANTLHAPCGPAFLAQGGEGAVVPETLIRSRQSSVVVDEPEEHLDVHLLCGGWVGVGCGPARI